VADTFWATNRHDPTRPVFGQFDLNHFERPRQLYPDHISRWWLFPMHFDKTLARLQRTVFLQVDLLGCQSNARAKQLFEAILGFVTPPINMCPVHNLSTCV